jgi:hypothetical protein
VDDIQAGLDAENAEEQEKNANVNDNVIDNSITILDKEIPPVIN